jgi:hypothetical protein
MVGRYLKNRYEIHARSVNCVQLTPNFNTDLQINLIAPIATTEPTDFFLMNISSAEIPFTAYNFSTNLNNLYFFVDGFNSLVLSQGNYDIAELINLINASALFPFNATYNINTSKITLLNADTITHILNVTNAFTLGLAKSMGFTNATDYTVLSGGSVTGNNCVQLANIRSLYFSSSNLSPSNVITTTINNRTSILDKIPILVNPFEMIMYSPNQTGEFSSRLDGIPIIKTINISVRDQQDILLQLNGANFEFTLLIELYGQNIENVPKIISDRRNDYVEPTQVAIMPKINEYIAPTPIVPVIPQNIPPPVQFPNIIIPPPLIPQNAMISSIDLHNALIQASALF